MKTNPCKVCNSVWHTAMYHKRKPLNKVGPITKKWIATKERWLENNKAPYYACYICGKIMTRSQLTLDHVKSRSRYPELRFALKNLQPCCYQCNQEKGSRDITEFKGVK